jgi:Ca-activated chloride channel family protein
LLDRITETSRASSQYVLPDEDIEVKVSSFFSKIKEPVLANPSLTFSGDIRTTKLYPSPLPDVFKGEQIVLAGRYSGNGDSAVTIEGTVNGTTRKFTYEVRFPTESSDNEFIPRLWATRRVGYLLDEIRLHGENSELRDEVTELARKYGIVTPYTAYLIVEDETRRRVPMASRSMQDLSKDKFVLDEASRSWSELNTRREGDRAVAGSQYNMELKTATAAPESVGSFSGGGGGRGGHADAANRSLGLPAGNAPMSATPAAPEVRARKQLVEYSQQSRFVNGRNFFQNGAQWTDAEVQKNPDAKRVRLQFGTPEYFTFASKNSRALPWLALGQNIQFVLDGTVYEIYE